MMLTGALFVAVHVACAIALRLICVIRSELTSETAIAELWDQIKLWLHCTAWNGFCGMNWFPFCCALTSQIAFNKQWIILPGAPKPKLDPVMTSNILGQGNSQLLSACQASVWYNHTCGKSWQASYFLCSKLPIGTQNTHHEWCIYRWPDILAPIHVGEWQAGYAGGGALVDFPEHPPRGGHQACR